MSSDKRREVVKAALRRQPPGRRPCFPLVDAAYASAHARVPLSQVQMDPATHAAALAQCLRELPIDGVYVNLCLTEQQAAAAAWEGDSWRVPLDGCLSLRIPANDVLSIEHTEIESLADPRIEEAQLFHPGMLACFRAMQSKPVGGAVVAGLTGTFSQVAFLFGLEKLLLALVDSPPEVHAALQRRHQVVLRQARDLLEAGAELIWIGEGIASGSLLSPAMYTRFVLPYEQELTDSIRSAGALSLLHICGNVTPMLPAIARCGADGCDIDHLTDWAAAVKTLSPALALKGNINPLLFLPGQGAELREACLRTVSTAKHCPGFLLSSGCLVPRDSDPSAFEVFARAAEAP